jgi:hypothetical protein
MAFTGDKVVAMAAGVDSQLASGTTTSTTYTATLTGGTACGVTFVAPPSGMVTIFNTVERNNSAGGTYSICGVEVRTGGTIGSGTVVGTTLLGGTTDDKSVFALDYIGRNMVHHTITGLTPGNTYNARQLFRVSGASTGTFFRKELLALPLP